ncbi:MAG TPA: response regulator transcription factor [Puia sp.]|nr:response regulator transcription factor [Puia sp.]
MKEWTVAIVDDHNFFREAARRCLTILGFKVTLEAANGMLFLQQLESCGALPDFCLLDVEMPIMNGVVTARLLRERYPTIRIVACTLVWDEAKKADLLRAGAHAILSKSMEPEEIRETFLGALGD